VTIEAWGRENSRPSRAAGRRGALATLATLAALALAPAGVTAQGSGFTISGIAAEASAETATAARERAIAGGLRSAWMALVAREAPADQARLGAVSAEELERLVESYEVENERVGPTRYAATLTVNFRPERVRSLLATAPARAPAGRLEVVAPLSGVNDWVEIRRRLANAPAVGGFEILALSRREARLALSLPGGQAGSSALEAAGLRLSDGPAGPTLSLAPGT
jgi:hypothetical protein